jgi:uncharacterized damage-inducible protein DinB
MLIAAPKGGCRMDIQKELISEFNTEVENARKILNAIPDTADFTWKPHEKSMTLGRLAGHVAELTGDWPLMTLEKDRLDWNPEERPKVPENKAEVLKTFETAVPKSKAAIEGFDPANWDRHWIFAAGGQVFIDQPKYQVWRSFVMNHLVHHRAQLGAYVRILGGKLPGCYGPSGDEM